VRSLLALTCALAALAFGGVGAVTLIRGEAPRAPGATHPVADLTTGVTAVAIGIAAAFAARALWRARHRRTSTSDRSRLAPFALGAALLATLAARFGDDFARRADDLVPPSGTPRLPHFTEAAFFEDPLEAAGLLLDAHAAREAYTALQRHLAADVIVSSRLALTGTSEHYARVGDGRYRLTRLRTERHLSTARNGVLVAQDVTRDDTPPDAERGESIHLTFAPHATPTTLQPADTAREVRSIAIEVTEHRPGDGAPVTHTLPNEVELVETDYDAETGQVTVRLRTTEAGQQRAAAALAELMRWRMTSVLSPAALGVRRVELDVQVKSLASAILALTATGVELVTDGPTVIEVTARGWR